MISIRPNANNLNTTDWTNWTYSGHPAYVWKILNNRANTPQTEEDIWINSVGNTGSLGNVRASMSVLAATEYTGLLLWASSSGGRYRVLYNNGVALYYFPDANADL